MPRNSFKLRFRYWLDNSLSRHLSVVMLWVMATLAVLVIAVAGAMNILSVGPNDSSSSFVENVWHSLTRSLDAGTFGQDQGDVFRFLGLIITISGLLAVSTMIGLISNAVNQRVEELRRGRTLVMESDHLLILGASKKLPIIIREIVEATLDSHKATIVILSDQDKVELEERLSSLLPNDSSIRIVVRRGEPALIQDLMQVSPQTARSIVILRPDETSGDAEVVRVTLAVFRQRQGLPRIPIVTELDNENIARSLMQALPEQIMTVVGRSLVSRVAAQTTKASGLGAVYQELLDFSGAEIYPVEIPQQLVGKSFRQAVATASTCSVIGYIRNESTYLVPHMDDVLQIGDEILVIAEDQSTIDFHSNVFDFDTNITVEISKNEQTVDSILIIGWNRFARETIAEIDARADLGSQMHLIVDPEFSDGFSPDEIPELKNHTITFEIGSTIDFDTIYQSINDRTSSHILVLACHDDLTEIESDARTLLTLMHIRKCLSESRDVSNESNLVSEIVDPSAIELAEIASPDDFIVSLRLVSLLITQLAQNPHRKDAIQQILSSTGPSIRIKPLNDYVQDSHSTFFDLVAAASIRGECAIGWQRDYSDYCDSEIVGRINLNPAKNAPLPTHANTKVVLLVK